MYPVVHFSVDSVDQPLGCDMRDFDKAEPLPTRLLRQLTAFGVQLTFTPPIGP
jgi:hypothetical protein